jgi:hypothetical protein
MATIISTDTSKQVIEKLIDDAFEKADAEMEHIYGEQKRIIETAKDFGLKEKAIELEARL